jgi:hypothetical protein
MTTGSGIQYGSRLGRGKTANHGGNEQIFGAKPQVSPPGQSDEAVGKPSFSAAQFRAERLMAAMNKYLAQSDKSRSGRKATKKRKPGNDCAPAMSERSTGPWDTRCIGDELLAELHNLTR